MNAVSYLDVGWHPGTVLLSVLVATFASYVSLELSRRVRDLDGAVAHAWWLGGSLTMGTGVWSMHFVGMLAFEPPLPLGYRHDLTALSWLAALVAAGMAMAVAGHRQVDRRLHLVASLVMTAGIVSMHYLGMAAIDLQPGIDWDWPLVGASVLIALIASAAALALFLRLRALQGRARLLAQVRSALVMAAAICGMHYTAMAAARLPEGVVCLSADALSGRGLLVVVVLFTALILCAALGTAIFDARMQRRERLMSQSLAEANAELQSANEELRRRTLTDPLTGLANRLGLEDRLARLSAEAGSEGGQAALIFIDLDGFKAINDSLGHAAGDRLLGKTARRIRRRLRPVDMAVRLGGDEFVLLLEGAEAEARAMRIARQLLSDLQHPFLLPEQQVTLSCSIGMAFAPRHGAGDMLLGCADAAMYAAKRSGGSCALCYDTHMASADSADQLQLQQGLREALQRGQLALHFQPKLSAADGSLHGVEALLRWRHPERGMISPAVFIPVAERFGLIGRIGDWVIEQACEQLARWQAQGLVCRVAINLSAHQLRQPDLARRILSTLERHGLDPSLLVCELTETAMMESIKDGCSVLDELDAAGVRVSIDDFGTGYSSLSYLRRLPASQLKIDRSMVTGIDVDRQARAVLESVIKLAHALDMEVVAEGVETEAQRQVLVEADCDVLQGYLFARPMDAHALQDWVRERAPRGAVLPLSASSDSAAGLRTAAPA
jgi:diguanylate cyclase (GGDEF)-like protein